MGISCEEIIHFSDFYMGDQSQKKKRFENIYTENGQPNPLPMTQFKCTALKVKKTYQ